MRGGGGPFNIVRQMKDRKDKIPELIRAARRSRDDETALLLLQKAKDIDPANLELYRLRAEIFERIGDEGRMLAELRAALAVDPTHWDVRYQLLNLEYPSAKNLDNAGGIVRDLAWDKGFPARLFNSSRGAPRSDNELSFDEAVLGHLAYPDDAAFAPIEIVAVAAAPGDEAVALVSSEPWLLRIGRDGELRFGIDLWIADEERGVERPADVAVGADGAVYVVDAIARCVRRFDAEGAYRGVLGAKLKAAPLAVACAPGKDEVLVLAEDLTVRRYDPAGKAMSKAAIPLGQEAPLSARGLGLAAGPDGAAYVVDRSFVAVIGPRSRKADAVVKLAGGERRARSKKAPARRGVAVDPRDGTLLVADPARGAISRHDVRTGEILERIAGKLAPRVLRDVAVGASGALLVADVDARRVARCVEGVWSVLWELART